MFLCNIVSGGRAGVNFPPMFNIVDEFRERVPGIPTFIIGWGDVRRIFPDADILSPVIREDIYWIYGPRERREKYESGLRWIEDFVMERMTGSVHYVFRDIMTAAEDEKRGIYEFLVHGAGVEYYIYNEMLYYLCGGSVYGLSLRDIAYEGGDPVRFLREIEGNGANHAIDGSSIPDSVRKMIGDRVYLIPYIMSNAA